MHQYNPCYPTHSYTDHFDSWSTEVAERETGFSRHAFSQPLTLYWTRLVPWQWLMTNVWGMVPGFNSAPPAITNHPTVAAQYPKKHKRNALLADYRRLDNNKSITFLKF